MTTTVHAPRRRRFTADQVSAGSVAWRMLAGLAVLVVFVAPYVLMFVSSLKSKSEILQVPPTFRISLFDLSELKIGRAHV